MKKITKVMVAALGAAVLFGFSGCKEKKSEIKTTVIGYRKGSLCAIPIHLAVYNGFLEEEFAKIGQKVEFLQQEPGSTATLVGTGKIDGGFELISSWLPAMENGLPIVFASGVHTGCTRYFVREDSGITSVEQLRGKIIGVYNLQDSSVVNIKRKLNSVGIKVGKADSEVTFQVFDMSALGIVLNNGTVDVIALHEPAATKVQKEFGFREILNTGTDPKLKDDYCCQIYVTEDFLEKNPEGVKAYIRAIGKASAFVQACPEEAAEIQLANDCTTGDLAENVEILKTLDYTPSYEKGKKTFIDAINELKEIGDLKESTDVEALLKRGYVKLDGLPEGYRYNKETKEFIEF